MSPRTITLLHPGNMGVTIGAAAAAAGCRVLWASENRRPSTCQRAAKADLHDVQTLTEAVRRCEVILAVCPPHAAVDVARAVAAQRFSGIYVDANAVSRATAEEIGAIIGAGGADFVDGGIIGPPVKQHGTTRLYLSGERADEVAALFSGSLLDARPIGSAPGAASALKVAYAAWTKCTDALILAIRAYAAQEGIDEALLEEWSISQPALSRKCERAAAVAVPKAWRYVGEMVEIAEAFERDGLPAGFHQAAAQVCERLACFKDQTDPPPSIGAVIGVLRR